MMSNKPAIILKILGLLFILTSLTSIAAPWINKTSDNMLLVVYSISYAVIMFTTGIGLLRMWRWSRIVAIVILVIKLIELLFNSVKDINTMLNDPVGRAAIPIGIAICLIFVLIIGYLIFFLLRPTTKNQFAKTAEYNNTQQLA